MFFICGGLTIMSTQYVVMLLDTNVVYLWWSCYNERYCMLYVVGHKCLSVVVLLH